MHDILRKRILRRLDALPERKLYDILDYIEFLDSKYGERSTHEPSGLQRFAERLEDRMRVRNVAPRVIGGAMQLFGAAGRVLDTATGSERSRPAPRSSARRNSTGETRQPDPAKSTDESGKRDIPIE